MLLIILVKTTCMTSLPINFSVFVYTQMKVAPLFIIIISRPPPLKIFLTKAWL